jgi:tetrahydromethanopterin S-methyltransferase subunit G
MHNEFNDVKHRISRVDSAIAGIRRDEAGTAEDIAPQQAAIDRIKDRLDRIELRLELVSDL